MTSDQNSVNRDEQRIIRVEIDEWRVLIVDDQFDNLMVAREALVFHGAKVKTAENGKHGFEVLKTFEPTLILLDLSMPIMNGWEMHEKLRADTRFDDVPIIALTAHVMHGDRTKVMEAGFDGYIPKPFSVATFVQRIRSILTGNAKGTS